MEDYGLKNFPQGDRFKALRSLVNEIYDHQRANGYRLTLEARAPDGVEQRIADVFGIPLAPFMTSIEAAFNLRDYALDGPDYINVDFREYDDSRGKTFICDIKSEYGESSDQTVSRASALTLAVVKFVYSQWEVNQ